MEQNTAKGFVLQLGSLISLYVSISFVLVLIFGIINLVYPDPAEGYYMAESAAGSVRLGIAMVIVFFPTYIILTRLINKERRREPGATYHGLLKWLMYLSLLIGGIVLLADLVAVIMGFLEGELTIRFILKALAVFLIVGASWYYYLLDTKGYWVREEKKSVLFGTVVSILIAISIVVGFTKIELPSDVREQKIDSQQLADLQNIQYRIEAYLAEKGRLPQELSELSTTGIELPQATTERTPYRYEATAAGFKLCATFRGATDPREMPWGPTFDETAVIKNRDNWMHGAGEHCFERTVTLPTTTIEVR